MELKILLVRPHPELPTSKWLQSMIRLEPYAQELIAGAVEAPHDVRICDLAVARDHVRFVLGGIRFGWQLFTMYKRYDRKYW